MMSKKRWLKEKTTFIHGLHSAQVSYSTSYSHSMPCYHFHLIVCMTPLKVTRSFHTCQCMYCTLLLSKEVDNSMKYS